MGRIEAISTSSDFRQKPVLITAESGLYPYTYCGMENNARSVVHVILDTTLYNTDKSRVFDLFMEIQDILSEALAARRAGYVDGHEFCMLPERETLTYYLCGSDTEEIIRTITPVVRRLPEKLSPRIEVPTDTRPN